MSNTPERTDFKLLNIPSSFVDTLGKVKSYVFELLDKLSYTGIIVANMIMFCIWIAGIVGMPIMYASIEARYSSDSLSGSELFKTIYAICHYIISVILFLYLTINIYKFSEETPSPVYNKLGGAMSGGEGIWSKVSNSVVNIFMSFLIGMPLNIREKIKKSLDKFLDNFKNINYEGATYKSQINLGIMFKLVVAQFPIIIFLIVFTSIVSMIKAYHKILCGNAKLDVIIDWPYRIIDIVIYAFFRIGGLFVAVMNWRFPNYSMPLFMPIFYFTAIYLIIRFILLLYENMFSDTIISLYKWDIRETDCTTKSEMRGNWILDSKVRKEVKDQQNLANSHKLTNDVFSLIFNILIILFLSGISIISVCLLIMYSDEEELTIIYGATKYIVHRTVTIEPAVSLPASEFKQPASASEVPASA
jgi:hypothetical protein